MVEVYCGRSVWIFNSIKQLWSDVLFMSFLKLQKKNKKIYKVVKHETAL